MLKQNQISKITFLISLLFVNTILFSQSVPAVIDYQGRLTDIIGDPVDGTVSIVFSIYDSETGGAELWTETQASVSVFDGLFHVLLGSVNALPDTLFNSSDRWIGINVEGDGEMIPRTCIASVAYAQTDGDWNVTGDTVFH